MLEEDILVELRTLLEKVKIIGRGKDGAAVQG